MKPLYVIHYSLFKGGSVLSRYRFFETKEKLDNFIKWHPEVIYNSITFKKIDLLKEVNDETDNN